MDAQGAVDSLLGRLTFILVNEAQLLGGIRSDVEFIKDEMESMNGLLLHLTEVQHRDHQVRAWMKQIVGLTRDCGGNIELYVHYVVGAESDGKGILGFLLRIPRFLRTVSIRHQIATRIQELKVRARDVGDRRVRYGVTVPLAEPYKYQTFDDRPVPQPGSEEEEEELQRRELLDRSTEPDIIIREESTNMLLEQLSKKLEMRDDGKTGPRFICIIDYETVEEGIARRVYRHPTVVNSFEHRVFADLATMDYKEGTPKYLLHKIMQQLPEEHLEGKKLIILLDNVVESGDSRHETLARYLHDFLRFNDFSVDSRLIVSTPYPHPMPDFSDLDSINLSPSFYSFFGRRALFLAKCDVPCANSICRFLYQKDDILALQMFFRLIYVSPNWPESEMNNLYNDLENNKSNTSQIMLRFCYKDLPSNHKSCLLYLSIFPQHSKIRRTSLLRRWIAEGLVSQRSNVRLRDNCRKGISMLDDTAESIFDALVTRGFLHPEETSAAGKIKTSTVPTIIHKFIVEESSYMDICMPPDLAHHLSINNGVELQEAPSLDRPIDDVLALLEQITESVPWQLLKVLDLEGCKGLTKKHLKAICQILLLKYLSLRGTDVNELPKQIEKLQCLETLDIRQTEVQTFSKRQAKLPMLRYFLAGHRESPSNSFSKIKDTFTTVRLPRGIRGMKKLQVLSYVDISDNMDDLNDVGELLQLRKLGVILDCKKDSLSALFRQIEKLYGCLRSLSIRISKAPDTGPQATAMDTPPKRLCSLSSRINNRLGGKASAGDTGPQATAMETPPKHLQSLKISGITGGLPLWIAALDQLEEISLSETKLEEEAMNTLGDLRILRCLQLLQGSYNPSFLKFKSSEFQQLRSLVVEGSVTNINFEKGTTPKLRTIVWSFPTMETLSGLDHLPKLKKLELHGKYNLDMVNAAIEAHPNNPVLEPKPHQQHQEEGTAAAEASSSSTEEASSSSAP